jgi:hypothetical protein
MKNILSLLFVAMISFAAVAQSGVEMIMSNKEYNPNGQSVKAERSNTVWITDSKMKITSSNDSDPVMIYDDEAKKVIVIDRKNRQYTEMGEKEMAEINAQMEMAKKTMEQQMANMPPQQREMMKKQMGQVFSMEEKKKTEYEKATSSMMVGPYSTTLYTGKTDGEKVQEIYIAGYDQMKVSSADFDVYMKMIEFMRESMGSMLSMLPGDQSASIFDEDHPTFSNGVPVKSVTYSDGKMVNEDLLQSISKKSIPSEAFLVPPGYKKKDIMESLNR